MNRRIFFKTITGFAAGIYAAFAPGKRKFSENPAVRMSMGAIRFDPDAVIKVEVPIEKRSDQWTHTACTCSDNVWRFYINGKEIDSSRAVNEHGGISWPFQGAIKGDLCIAKSPTVEISKNLSGQQWRLDTL